MSTALQPLDVTAIRKDFPLLSRVLNGKPVVYLDSAVSGQMPLPAIERPAAFSVPEDGWLSPRAGRDRDAVVRSPSRAHLAGDEAD